MGSIPGSGRSPGEGHGNPLLNPCLEHPHGQRGLAGYSPRGHKEVDMTERLSLHFMTSPLLAEAFLSLKIGYPEEGRQDF